MAKGRVNKASFKIGSSVVDKRFMMTTNNKENKQ